MIKLNKETERKIDGLLSENDLLDSMGDAANNAASWINDKYQSMTGNGPLIKSNLDTAFDKMQSNPNINNYFDAKDQYSNYLNDSNQSHLYGSKEGDAAYAKAFPLKSQNMNELYKKAF